MIIDISMATTDEREQAAKMALAMYVGEPCRICGQQITDLKGVVFAGYSDDSTSRAAHGLCWRNMVDVIRKAHKTGILDKILQ